MASAMVDRSGRQEIHRPASLISDVVNVLAVNPSYPAGPHARESPAADFFHEDVQFICFFLRTTACAV